MICSEWFKKYGKTNEIVRAELETELEKYTKKAAAVASELEEMHGNYRLLCDTSKNLHFQPGETRESQINTLKKAITRKLNEKRILDETIKLHNVTIDNLEKKVCASDLKKSVVNIKEKLIQIRGEEDEHANMDFARELDGMYLALEKIGGEDHSFLWASPIDAASSTSLFEQQALNEFLGDISPMESLPTAPSTIPSGKKSSGIPNNLKV